MLGTFMLSAALAVTCSRFALPSAVLICLLWTLAVGVAAVSGLNLVLFGLAHAAIAAVSFQLVYAAMILGAALLSARSRPLYHRSSQH